MKLDTTMIFTDPRTKLQLGMDAEGKRIPGTDAPKDLGDACSIALLVADGAQTDFQAKASQYKLAMKLLAGGEVAITTEEATMIKQAVGRVYGPMIVGPAVEALNGDAGKVLGEA